MAGTVHVVMRLLLLTFIQTGINGEDSLIIEGETYWLTFPCGKDSACYDVWHFSATGRRDYAAIVRNGEIRASKSKAENSKCTLRKEDQTEKDVQHRRCQQSPESTAAPELILRPGETLSLQCVLLSYVRGGHCYTTRQRMIELMWVDEEGAHISEDSTHQIKRESSCDTTLIVSLDSPANTSFRCQVTVDEWLWTSAELRVRVPDLSGRGRGLILDPKVEDQVHSQSMIWAAAGVAGCMVLTALVAIFAARRRRRRRKGANQQLPHESCNTISNSNDVDSDEVVYADIVLPIASGGRQIQEFDSTEYASIRCE